MFCMRTFFVRVSVCLSAGILMRRNNSCDPGDITSVVVSLGGKTADVGETMLTDGTTHIINAMKAKVGHVASMRARFLTGILRGCLCGSVRQQGALPSKHENDAPANPLAPRPYHGLAVLTPGAGIADAGCMQGVKRIAVVTPARIAGLLFAGNCAATPLILSAYITHGLTISTET